MLARSTNIAHLKMNYRKKHSIIIMRIMVKRMKARNIIMMKKKKKRTAVKKMKMREMTATTKKMMTTMKTMRVTMKTMRVTKMMMTTRLKICISNAAVTHNKKRM